MSGGIAYVLRPGRDVYRAVNTEMVDLDPLDEDDVRWLRDLVRRHGDETGSPVAARILATGGTTVERLPQGHAQGLQAGPRGPRVTPRSGPSTSTKRSWRRPVRSGPDRRVRRSCGSATGRSRRQRDIAMGDPTGFLKYDRELPQRRPGRAAPARLARGLRRLPAERALQGRRRAAWTAASRSATTAARWAT